MVAMREVEEVFNLSSCRCVCEWEEEPVSGRRRAYKDQEKLECESK